MIIISSNEASIITELPEINKIAITDVNGTRDNLEFTYTFPVEIDLRAALENNISRFSIKVLNRPFEQTIGDLFVKRALGVVPNTQTVGNSIETFAENDLINFFNNQTNAVERENNIDFTNLLNNQVVSRFDQLSDEQLFGTQAFIDISSADANKDKIDLTIPLNDLTNTSENINFESAVDLLYQEGGDPASAFYSMQDELSYVQSMQGLTIKEYAKTRVASTHDYLINALRAPFITNEVIEESVGTGVAAQKPRSAQDRFKSYLINESLRYQKVNFDIQIDQNLLARTVNKVYVAITAYDMWGLILDIKSLAFSHATLANNIELFSPNIHLSATKGGVNRDIPILSIYNDSNASIGATVYYKITYECGSLDNMRFRKITEVNVKSKETKRIKFTGLDFATSLEAGDGGVIGINTAGSILFRVTPSVRKAYLGPPAGRHTQISNTYFTSIGSSFLERNQFAPIMCYNRGTHANITVSNIPKNVRRLEVVRRNLTLHERDFTRTVGEGGYYALVNSVKNVKSSFSVDDYSVRDEHKYEYKCVFYYGPGESFKTINSFIYEHLTPTGKIKLKINSSNIRSGIFQVSGVKPRTVIDSIYDQISLMETGGANNNQAYDFYKEYLEEVKQMILTSQFIRVVRYNMTTGGAVNLGQFDLQYPSGYPGKTARVRFMDHFTRNPGSTYTYEVQPYVKSLFSMLVMIRSTLKEISQQYQDEGINLIFETIAEAEPSLISSSGDKFFNRSVYKRSTIQSNKQRVEEVNSDLTFYGRTGDIIYTEMTMPEQEILFYNNAIIGIKDASSVRKKIKKIETLKEDELPTIKAGEYEEKYKPINLVKISYSVQADLELIDYFIITCQKNGALCIVGSVHCTDDDPNFTYIDDSQQDYQGVVKYFITAVLENKKRVGPTLLGVIPVGVGDKIDGR